MLRRGLQPLQRVASVAEQILDTNDFSRRVTVKTHARDVVGQVSQLLNRLLARVDGLLESQKRLLADTSHELRNPLTIIGADLDMLAHDLPAELRREVASEVKSEVERLARLLDGLLALSWTEQKLPLPREPVRLDVLAEELVGRNRRAHPDREINYQGVGPIYLLGDRDRLLQAASNLLANALRYTEGRIWVSVAQAGREGLLEVADEGPGIPADQHEAIWERFVRLDKVHKRGTGLGLPIVRAITEAHGGRVEVESRPGKGVLFRLRLPLEGSERH
jgi:signal transduction histidine kinase